jgi:DNA repair exonuclease SbcCD ATPase subunit
MVAQWKADSEDATKPETVRAEALAEMDNEQSRLDELNAFITNVQNRQTELTDNLKTQRGKQDEAATFLAEAEEKRAKQQMAEQQAIFEAFKQEYNVLKGEYDTIAAKEHDGTITDFEYARMDELQGLYEADKEKFDAFEEERVHKVRDNTEKEFNKEKNAVERMRTEVAAITAELAAQQTANTKANADFTTLTTDITKLKNTLENLTVAADKETTQQKIRDKQRAKDNAEVAKF